MPIYNDHIQSKLPKVDTNIFTLMSRLSNDHNALNLSQGFPDFEVDELLIKTVQKYFNKGFHQYAPMQGVLKLREQISKKVEKLYDNYYSEEDEINITSGATQAIFTAISAFVKEDDEVILFTPAFDCYQPAVELNGGKPVFVQLKSPEFSINWEEVKKVITQKTKMIVVNSPNNPTGTTLSENDYLSLQKITLDSNIIVLSDEVYEHLVFDGEKHNSVCGFKDLANRSIAIFSFGKTFHVTGWKLGYVLAPKNLMKEIRKVHQFSVFSSNHPLQMALAEYMENEDNYLRLNSFYQEKRDLFLSIINASRFQPLNCQGTYFQLLNYEKISDLPDTEMAKDLVQKNGIASIPISVFYHSLLDQHLLRFCFAKKTETLNRAGEILIKI
jgi:methionine aminotransferase